jgi:hypothetical protein
VIRLKRMELNDLLNPPVVRWLIVTARADLEYCRPGVVRDLTQSLWNALASAELNMCCWLRPLPPRRPVAFLKLRAAFVPGSPFSFRSPNKGAAEVDQHGDPRCRTTKG